MFTLLLTATVAVAAPPPVVPAAPPALAPITTPAPLVALPPLPPVDPARLALARIGANVWFRDGSLARIVDNMFSTRPDSYASSMLDLSLAQLAAMAGMPLPGAMGSDSAMTLRQMAAKNDPYFDQRMAAIHAVAVAEIVRLAPRFEPQVRDGLAQSMARRFTAQQLTDMNRFLTTPSGQAFADNSYLMWMDPAVFRSALGTVPGLVGEMPGVMARLKAANDRYPSPKPKVKAPEPAPRKSAPKKPVSRRKT